jgi:hypothetical protein
MPGEKRLGAVVYELDNATLTARIAEVPGLTQHWFDGVIDGAASYGPPKSRED